MTTTPETPAAGGAPVAPAGARFDPATGAELSAGAGAGGERRRSYALQPGEPVASFNLVTSLMPLASGTAPQTYRWALGLGILIPVVAGALGFLAFAFVAAAVVVPAIYVVYMYDVNQWEDQPIGVVLGAIGAAAALGVGFTFLWHAGILDSNISSVNFDGNGAGGVRWSSLLVLVLLVPIVSEALKQVGPLVLAGRPQFDDMIDGLTFGVAAGAAFAAAETIVVNRGLFSSFGQVDSPERRLLGLADPLRRGGQADRVRRRHRHRRGLLLRPRGRLRRLQARLLPRPRRGADRQHRLPGRPVLRRPARGHHRCRRRPGVGCADRGRTGGPAALPPALRGARGRAGGGGDRHRAEGQRPAGRRTAPRARCRCWRARTSASRAARRCAPAAR